MKMRIILGIVLALLAFGGGIAGMYYAMPYIAPDRVAATQKHLDSLQAVSDEGSLSTDSSLLVLDSTALIRDSLATLATSHDELVASLQDSIAALQDQLYQRETESTTLRDDMQQMQQTMQELQSRKEQTVELANTLAKLEDRELEGILSRLNTGVLEQLYFEASGRNRRRLLQSMPAARAATFVGRLVSDDGSRAQTPASLSSSEPPADTPGAAGTN